MPERAPAPRPAPGLERVEAAAERVREAELALDREVAAARAAGATWQDVAAVFGISRQAAHNRFADATDSTGQRLEVAPRADVATLTRQAVARFVAGDIAELRESMTQACARALNVGTLNAVRSDVLADYGEPRKVSVSVHATDGTAVATGAQSPLPAVGRAILHHEQAELWLHVLVNRAGKISGMVIRPEEIPETWPL